MGFITMTLIKFHHQIIGYLCVSIVHDVAENSHNVVTKIIPANRCGMVRHFGSRKNITAVAILYEDWLPNSGEILAEYPVFFHYVNVGPKFRNQK